MLTSAEKYGEETGKGAPGTDTGPLQPQPPYSPTGNFVCLLSSPPPSQPNFDLAPSSHLISGEVQDLDCGGYLNKVRQAIQLVQFVAAQVQGQQLLGKEAFRVKVTI